MASGIASTKHNACWICWCLDQRWSTLELIEMIGDVLSLEKLRQSSAERNHASWTSRSVDVCSLVEWREGMGRERHSFPGALLAWAEDNRRFRNSREHLPSFPQYFVYLPPLLGTFEGCLLSYMGSYGRRRGTSSFPKYPALPQIALLVDLGIAGFCGLSAPKSWHRGFY